MTKTTAHWIKWLAVLLVGCVLCGGCSVQEQASAPTAAPSAQNEGKTSGVGFYFDTVVTLTLWGAPEGLMDTLWSECTRYEQLLSKTVPGSDVSRLNEAEGKSVTVDAETYAILRRAKEISDATGHAFSVTIAPLTAMWDFTGGTQRMPTDEERIAALPLVNDDLLVLGDGNTVTLHVGMEVDLGGIAKGYIADRLADMVRQAGCCGTLNFGGNVYAVGAKTDGTSFNIGIQDPKSSTGAALCAVQVTDKTVVTSGIYERCFEKDGVLYHHILDPVTGLPAQTDLAGVSIVGQSSMDADAYATACIVLGLEKAKAMLEEAGMDGILIDRSDNIYLTEGFEQDYPIALMNQP